MTASHVTATILVARSWQVGKLARWQAWDDPLGCRLETAHRIVAQLDGSRSREHPTNRSRVIAESLKDGSQLSVNRCAAFVNAEIPSRRLVPTNLRVPRVSERMRATKVTKCVWQLAIIRQAAICRYVVGRPTTR